MEMGPDKASLYTLQNFLKTGKTVWSSTTISACLLTKVTSIGGVNILKKKRKKKQNCVKLNYLFHLNAANIHGRYKTWDPFRHLSSGIVGDIFGS